MKTLAQLEYESDHNAASVSQKGSYHTLLFHKSLKDFLDEKIVYPNLILVNYNYESVLGFLISYKFSYLCITINVV